MEILLIGAVRGALYSLVAVGFVLVFSVGGILNLAHGTYYMLGAYLTVIIYSLVFSAAGPIWLIVSGLLAVLLVGFLATIVYYVLLRPQIHSLTYVMVMTLALALFVSEIMSLFFGTSGTSVPSFVTGSSQILGTKIINQQLLLLPITGLLLPGLWLFLRFSKWGQAVDSVAQQRTAAVLAGVNVEMATLLTYGLSASLAAMAGVLIAPVSSVVPEMWLFPLIKAFAIAILGGIGSLPGAVLASFLLGYAEVMSSFWLSDHLSDMVALVLIALVLIFKPSGILGQKGR
jgi:branched-chain amino acid transport system permease protein